ncbi:MAG: hypothetical protein HW405_571 [Candidatus Berkelbacteria bacterium]|nr:hypothetical protein [Candidatus Berkelbacteria bacterium]
MKKTLALFSGMLLGLAILIMPGVASAASGGQGPGGGGTAGGVSSTSLLVDFSFSKSELVCGQDNDVSLTVANRSTTTTMAEVGFGFESKYNPEIKSPSEGQDGVWSVIHLTDAGYTGVRWDTTAANAIVPGEQATYSVKVNVPCGPSEIKVLGAASANVKAGIATTEPTFKMVSGISVLPKTGSDTSALYYAILVGLPILRDLRKFIK